MALARIFITTTALETKHTHPKMSESVMEWFVKLKRNTEPRQLVQKAVDGYNSVLRVKPSRMRLRMGICNDRYGVSQCHSWWMDGVSGTIGSLLG